jgi:DNA-directed RNA polymerase specialized sigma24 family protein
VTPDSERVFEELLSEHLDGLYRTALRLEKTQRKAAELVAATIRNTVRSLGRTSSADEFRMELFRRLLEEARWSTPAGVIASNARPFGTADLNQVTDARLLEAIDGLGLPFRLAIWLHDVEGFDSREVSQLLGLSLEDTKRCLYGARSAVCEAISRLRLRA